MSDSVAQVIVCNFDSVSRVELFAHARAGALIHLNIREYPDGPRVASSGQRASGNLKWIPFDAFTYYRAFVRGRQYEFRFTWSGADPMRYYFSPDTHDLEHAIVGGVVRDSWDLAMVGGLVQIPCIERNAAGAVSALNAASLAMISGGVDRVSFDDVVEAMHKTGLDLDARYKETARGGLAIDPDLRDPASAPPT